MAIIQIHGDVKTTSNPRRITIWETNTSSTGKEFKRPWAVWFEAGHSLADGDWVELRGEFSDKIQETKNPDGSMTISTWTRADGAVMQNIDRIINSPEIIKHTPKEQPAARVIDEDDLRKYGPPF